MQSGDDNHVTAAKLSNVNGRELLLTYSGGPVCLYDIFDEPETEPRREQNSALQTSRNPGKRKAEHVHVEESSNGMGSKAIANSRSKTLESRQEQVVSRSAEEMSYMASTREPLILPEPMMQHQVANPASDFVADSLEDNPSLLQEQRVRNSSGSPVYAATTRERRESSQQEQEALRASLRHSSSNSGPTGSAESPEASTSSPPRRNFEIRVGDDGNLEMEIDDDPEARASSEDEPALNTEGYQALLRNLAARQSPQHEGGSAQEEEEDDDDDDDDDESDEPEFSESDGISTSDDPKSPEETGHARRAVNREIPLVRPQKIYKGHRNVDTVKDVNFGGMDNLVVSGSDDGNVFIYDKTTTDLITIIKGDDSVVNVMQYHPSLPIMAVSGIDNSAKILAPTSLGSPEGKVYLQRKFSRLASKEEIMRKNQDASWTSERLAMPPSILINLLNRAAAAGAGEDDDEDGSPGQRRRIPLSALLQLAGEEDTDQDCVVM